MNNVITILAIYVCVGCGIADKLPKDLQPKTFEKHRYSMEDHDSTFDSYVKGFPNRKKQIPIVFVDTMEDNKAGVCYSWKSGHREIEINKEVWGNYSENQRRALIWHELGHCELDLDHVNLHMNEDNEICVDNAQEYKCSSYTPLSIMRWYLPHDSQIHAMCERSEIDSLSRSFCNNLESCDAP